MTKIYLPSVMECEDRTYLYFVNGRVCGKSIDGVVGPTGPEGPPGPAGAAGPTGPAGSTGPQGVKGDTGNTGPQGPAGTNGTNGAQGIQGIQGIQGVQGPAGPANLVMGRIAADIQQTSNVTYSNLFTQAVAASEVWSFDATLYFLTAAATTGIVVALSGPASPANVVYALETGETATAWRTLPASAFDTALVGTAGLSTILVARVSGTVENGSNAGTLTVKFRSEVNGSGVTVKRGSYSRFFKH